MPAEPFLERYRWVILLLTGAVLLAALAYLLLQPAEPVTIIINPPAPTATHTPTGTLPPTHTPAPLQIYVTGAVNQPAARLALPAGARVEDAILAAGGARDDADLGAVNLAGLLRDGDMVHVPSKNAPTENPTPTPNAPRLINLNTATQAELETLPRIGPALAAEIIAYREANGGFTSIADLDNVAGIGAATLEGLRPLVTVE